ncbi:hypothetical protein MRX96_050339, partial [Rhipicephalus microplus]
GPVIDLNKYPKLVSYYRNIKSQLPYFEELYGPAINHIEQRACIYLRIPRGFRASKKQTQHRVHCAPQRAVCAQRTAASRATLPLHFLFLYYNRYSLLGKRAEITGCVNDLARHDSSSEGSSGRESHWAATSTPPCPKDAIRSHTSRSETKAGTERSRRPAL